MNREEIEFRNTQWAVLIIAIFAIGLSFIMSPNPEDSNSLSLFGIKLPPLCYSKTMFNVDCPGCGLTRSFVHISHGNIKESINFNSCGVLLYLWAICQIPLKIYYIATNKTAYKKWEKIVVYGAFIGLLSILMISYVYNLLGDFASHF